ncbi:carbohydrate-binding protein [Gilvimarinus agarilyticus]|uniref:di-heme oxidoredictase family protein n=1 Tax=Gilvimarinus sp. 2_MG-2023 TaxID=3062666 RepID=UPI001C086AC6|nr:di-heme oxidoredictase family protein [Gilvimarinus sp. 2_MG-2023]MBU2887853.1 carbohydrate-binding protein [Gilvimarinus agarilyticus]MDO6572491.1 di-heme oxidoredictase family protein [Gilvimarinus sp. 2_MG-2023]
MNKRNRYSVCRPLMVGAAALTTALAVSTSHAQQVGQLLWEDNFDNINTNHWNVVEGNGCQLGPNLCGWGNQELEYYQADNVSIEAVPGEPGNSALVFEARAENVEGSAFTSGKLDSQNAVAIQYGMIETRIRVPNLETGLWPAFWLLGTTTASWPAKGEIDMMEMGHRQTEIDHFHAGATPNSFVGGNAIFYSDDACVEGNPTCAAMSAWQTDNAYVSQTPMNDRFITYRLYWTDQSLRFAVVDNGVEYDMYDNPVPITDESDEFRAPFYLLMNMAVGGNFTDAQQNSEVTAPLPAKMYVDYVRVYEYDGMGEVTLGDTTQAEVGTFGVFTDNTATDNKLEPGVSSDIYIWSTGSLTGGTEPADEGDNVISWDYTAPGQWFGGGIQSRQPLNMSNFADGTVTFRIKAPADVSFRIGVTDTYTNEHYIDFPAGVNQYGLVRNGEWGTATVPVSDLRGALVALQSLAYPFVVLSGDTMPSANFSIAIDDIIWQGGGSAADDDADGVANQNDACPGTPAGIAVDSSGCAQVSATDTDNDGVLDGDDACPNTQAGASVNATGCSADSVKIQAEDYINFLDSSAGNNGSEYRNDDVDIEVATDTDGGYNVGWTESGEWLEYSTDLAAGTYQVTARVAALNDGGALSVGINGAYTSSSSVSSTGGWQNWQSLVLGNIEVAAGNANVRINIDAAGLNLNWINLEKVVVDSDGDGVTDNIDQCPATATGAQVDADGCAITNTDGNSGVNEPTEGSLEFYLNMADWADLHYRVNGGGQINVAMVQGSGRNTYNASGLSSGDVVDYSFTYWDANLGGAVDSPWESYTVGAGSNPDPGPDPDPTPGDSDNDGVVDANDQCPNTAAGVSVDANGCPVTLPPGAQITPLFDNNTALEPVISFDRGDALITRFSDRARDRHAKENHFQAYDHYLSFYWEDRTAAIEIIDYVAKGGDSIRMNVRTEFKLSDTEAENRWWYEGLHTLAQYCGNGVMNTSDNVNYWKEENWNCREGRPIQMGDKLEFEISQFLDVGVPRGRANYYGTTYLYIVGEGIVPWDVTDKVEFVSGNYLQRDTIPVPERARMGGDTTLHVQMTAEPDGHFQQMATNLGYDNGQPFVLGRHIHHSSFVDGVHDESAENGVNSVAVGKAGPNYINERCSDCHVRNGRASVAEIGESLDRWVFKIGDANGNPEADRGRVLQPRGLGGEGDVAIQSWTESGGLRSPNYTFSNGTPETFSARLAPNLNGLGLLEAIPESAILALEDPNDADGDGISGRANRIADPETGVTRLGRFGYKAAAVSVKHQVAAAFNTDMGVMTSLLPNPDCGSAQNDCGPAGSELADEHLDNLVKYVSLLGVRPQRNYNEPAVLDGEQTFDQIGCADCHTPTHQTSEYHPLAELRDQTIRPYTDMLLHDMGPGLADNLGEGEATGSEWRTAPLWGVGLSACVTGGVEGGIGWDGFGLDGYETCVPDANFLHDGRARTIDEAIRWHGGEALAAKQAYDGLSNNARSNLLSFIESL